MARRLAWPLAPLAFALVTLTLAACSLASSNEPDLKSTVGALQNEQIALQATVNALSNRPAPSPPPASAPAGQGANPTRSPATPEVRYVVANTEGQGVSMRAEPSTSANVVEKLAEGTEVVEIGQERNNDSRVWRNIRTADNKEGWIASDFLVPAQPRTGGSPAPSATATPQA